MATPIIDMHAHFYGGGLHEALAARTQPPCLTTAPDGTPQMIAMNGAFPFLPRHHDHTTGLADMAAYGITHRLLTFPGALGVDVLPAGIAPTISAFNTHLHNLNARSDGALIGLAGLPLADLALARTELARIRTELALPGIILPLNYFRSIRDLAPLRPLLADANALRCLIMVHPGLMVGETTPPPPDDNAPFRRSAADLQASIAQAVLTLILSDVLDEFPNIRFQVVNLGGTLPFIAERLDSIARHRSADTPFPAHRLKRLWFDCASLGPRALECAVAVLGADRIMLGSDYPIFLDAPHKLALDQANLTADQKRQIAYQNAKSLLEGLGQTIR